MCIGNFRGAGYIFVQPSGGWANTTQSTKLTASDAVNHDYLGLASAMSADGHTIVLSVPTPNALATPNRAAHVFELLWHVTNGAPAAGVVGVPYSFSFTTDIATPVTWSVNTGALPPGLTLGASTGVLSGTPTAPGKYAFTVQADSGDGALAAQQVTLTIRTRLRLPMIVR